MRNRIFAGICSAAVSISVMGFAVNAEDTESGSDTAPNTGNASAACYIVPAALGAITFFAKKKNDK